jgi:hypothetical protein
MQEDRTHQHCKPPNDKGYVQYYTMKQFTSNMADFMQIKKHYGLNNDYDFQIPIYEETWESKS